MKEKFPKIYKNKVENIKTKIQEDFYYYSEQLKNNDRKSKSNDKLNKNELLKKINNIFLRPDYVYQANITIMLKNGENIEKKVIGIKENNLMCLDGERIHIDEIEDIK